MARIINITHENYPAKRPNRQVSLITKEGQIRLKEDRRKGFCHNRFKGDIVIEGFNVSRLKPMEEVEIGTALIQITEVGKDCHEGCPAFTSEGACGINRQIIFGRILKEGYVKIRDEVN